MTKNYKILAEFIKDMSCETQDVETFLFIKDNITKYSLENITLLQDIDESFYKTKYTSVDIKNVELLNNKSLNKLVNILLKIDNI